MPLTWTETHRVVSVKTTVAVKDAPDITDLIPGVVVRPTEVTFGTIDREPCTVGIRGDLISGPGSKSGGHLAKVWPWREAPEWLRELGGEVL